MESLFEQLCELSRRYSTEYLTANAGELKGYVSHTTIGALRVADGSVVAFSDGQLTQRENLRIVSRDYNKVIRISDTALFLISGVPKIAKDMAKILRITFDNYSKIYDRRVTVRAEVNHIESLLARNFPMVQAGLMALPILVTYDNNKDKVRIFSFSVDGSSVAFDKFKLGGSGESAWGYMEAKWHDRLTREEGIGLANEYLDVVYKNDAGSGGIRSIYVVSRRGIEKIEGGGR